jgi:hypothetical protein
MGCQGIMGPTPGQLIVQHWRNGWKKAHIAAAMGISRKCVRIWI